MEILENELANSRLQKEKKTADFIKQIEKEKRKHEREVDVPTNSEPFILLSIHLLNHIYPF